jgi:Rieske Fe-S protein
MKDNNLPPIQSQSGKWDKGAMSRRGFLQLGVLTTTSVGALTVSGVMSRFLVGDAMEAKEGKWVQVGDVEGLPPGEVHKVAFSYRTTDAWRKVERSGTLYAFSDDGSNYVALDATCTHLGCLVRWKKDDNHFACPCHQGLFSKEGEVLAGAPSKPLRQLQTKIENGLLLALV